MSLIYVLKNPDPFTRAVTDTKPDARPGWEQMEEADFIAWLNAQPEITPPVPVPSAVARRDLLKQLYLLRGITVDQILAVIGQIPDASDRYIAQLDFEQAINFHRDHPLIGQLAAVFGLTAATVDAIFIAAQ